MISKKKNDVDVIYLVSPQVTNNELNLLFATREFTDFRSVLDRSLAFVCAYHADQLIGFVNLAWDGGIHAFILDTFVDPKFRRNGIGISLVKQAAEVAKIREIEWLHVDFEPHLQSFYDKCGFRNTNAGVMNLLK